MDTSNEHSEMLPSAGMTGINNIMSSFRDELSKYCVNLSYVPNRSRAFKDWGFGTGFLLSLPPKMFVVTAGHFLKEVTRLIKCNDLLRLNIRYGGLAPLEPKDIPEQTIKSSKFEDCDDLDVGLFQIPDDHCSQITDQSPTMFCREDFLTGSVTKPHAIVLCGYPSFGNGKTERDAFYSQQDGKWHLHKQRNLTSIVFESVLLSWPENGLAVKQEGFDANVQSFHFGLVSGKVRSASEGGCNSARGMSGGPVVALEIDPSNPSQFFSPKLLGMQYAETRADDKLTGIKVQSACSILNWIDGLTEIM